MCVVVIGVFGGQVGGLENSSISFYEALREANIRMFSYSIF